MSIEQLIFDHGDRVRCWGYLVWADDGCWLELARAVALVPQPPGSHSDIAVRLTGDGLNGLAKRGDDPYHVEVVGIWSDDATIAVESWRDYEYEDTDTNPSWTDPPCPAPPEGWSRGNRRAYDMGKLETDGIAVTRVNFRPTPRQEIVVIAATDVEAVIKQLGPQLPNRLCVVQSRFTKEQLDGAFTVLDEHWEQWRLESSTADAVDAAAQPFVQATALRVTPEMAAWMSTLAPGLLDLTASIVPAGH